MTDRRNLWTREQLTIVLNLYSKITFGQMHSRNPLVIELAEIIGRTSNAVALKLVNFASLDPRLKQKGMGNTSDLDKEVWAEYINNWEDTFAESEQLLARQQGITIEKRYNIDLDNYKQKDGKEVERLVKTRINQEAFRGAVLTNFNNQCCITGIGLVDLLVASHIAPWSADTKNRLNPSNGLALNSLHDKAFDKHLITITEDLKIKISSPFYKHEKVQSIKQNFIDFDGTPLIEPKKFYPDLTFIKIHNDKFRG